MRDAIRSLKDTLGVQPELADESPAGTSGIVLPHGALPQDPNTIGTGGAWSVETRYPHPESRVSSDAERSRLQGRLLSRAGQAISWADGKTWAWIALVSFAAAVFLLTLALRR